MRRHNDGVDRYGRSYCTSCGKDRKCISTPDGRVCQACFEGDDRPDSTYFETPIFVDYCAMVEAIVHQSETPVGTRQIHETLGVRARREWTLDALEQLRSVQLIEGIIDRWQPKYGVEPVYRKKWTKGGMAWLFARKANDSATYARLGVTA